MELERKMKLSAPWETYWHEIQAMFMGDPEIRLMYLEDERLIKMYVENTDKATALSKILPEKVDFGNVDLQIQIIPANKLETNESIYTAAFKDNPNFCFATTTDTPPTPSMTFVVFQPRIAQFYNDNMRDYYGNKNILMQDVANEILNKNPEVCFCTAKVVENEENG